MAQQTTSGLGRVTVEVPRLHTVKAHICDIDYCEGMIGLF